MYKQLHQSLLRYKNQPVKISDISKSFENITIHTLKKDLQYMKTEKMITALGVGKGTVYINEK